jgi:NAD(P)-dependent dehydrogenase (short-subunit alcohol dehydrogenase family)
MKRILISGASTGIGRACAESLARQGHQVFAGVRSDSVSFDEKTVTPVILEVTSEESIQSCLKKLESGGIDVLINNAGIAVGGPLEAVGLEKLKQQFEVNVFGLYELTRAALPFLRKSSQAMVLNVSSVSGMFAAPYFGPYSASKFAVEALSDSWRRELRKFSIPVVLLEPGPIKTPIWEKSILKTAEDLEASEVKELYEPELTQVLEHVEKEAKSAVPVEELAELVDRIVASKKPKARYVINGRKSLLRVMAMLPESWVDSIFEKGLAKRR